MFLTYHSVIVTDRDLPRAEGASERDQETDATRKEIPQEVCSLEEVHQESQKDGTFPPVSSLSSSSSTTTSSISSIISSSSSSSSRESTVDNSDLSPTKEDDDDVSTQTASFSGEALPAGQAVQIGFGGSDEPEVKPRKKPEIGKGGGRKKGKNL